MGEKTIRNCASEDTLSAIRILDANSWVTDGSTVLYPSEARLEADLADINYCMPENGMYTVEEFLARVGTGQDAGLQMSLETLAALLMDLAVQAAQYPRDEISSTTVGALIKRFAQHIAEQA